MQPIQGFENTQAIHGRNGGMLPGGAYVMVITAASEDTTGYGAQSLRIAYDVAEGDYAGRYADIAADPEQNWKHQVEIDVEEGSGARLKALVEAVQASNPGYVWDWNEQGLVGKWVGIVLQERKVTLTKGKNRGKDRTYLDFWDAVPIDAVRAGQVPTPPVNDKREAKKDEDAPVPVPTTYQPQAQAPMVPQMQPGMPAVPQQAPMPQQPMYQPQGYQQPVQNSQLPQVPASYGAQAGLYDADVPF